jgi:LPS sulfotransferase NodH
MPRFFLPHQFVPYVILFIERDGSTYLSSLLSSHPNIEAVYERFAVLKQKNATSEDQLDWAEKFFTPAIINTVSARGFKTKLIDILDQEKFKDLCIKKNLRIIHMHRRNRVKAVISKINAKRLYDKSGYWNLYEEKDRIPATLFDINQIDELMIEREMLENELDKYVISLNLPTLKVTYEDLLTKKDVSLKTIFDFLKVPMKPVESKTIKHTDDDLQNVILNFEEVKNHYINTPYFDMFSEAIG